MSQLMKVSKRILTLHCSNCNLKFNMSYGTYHGGGFIERRCPRCGFLDTSNSIGAPDPKTKSRITIREIDPC